MRANKFIFAALVLFHAIPSTASGQDRNAKANDPYADLMPYVHHDFCAAVVAYPHRITRSLLGGKSIPLAKLMASVSKEGLDPAKVARFADPDKIHRITLLVDPFPGGNLMFEPAVVVEYVEDTPGGEMLRALFPSGRASSEDKRLFVGLDSTAGGTSVNGYIAGPKMILIAPEPTLKKMLSKYRSPRHYLRPLLDAKSAESDLFVGYASRPALEGLLKMTGMTAAQFRSDPETDEAVKTLLLDVNSASLHVQLQQAPSIRASVRCDELRTAAEIHDMLDMGKGMLLAVLESKESRNEMKSEMKKEMQDDFPKAVEELIDSAELRDLVRSTAFTRRGAEIEVKLEVPDSIMQLARRSTAGLVGEASNVASRPWSGAKQFQWKRKESPVSMMHRDEGFAMLTGVQGRLAPGAEVSILPNPDGAWTLRGTDHAGIAGRAVTVPWFVEAEQPTFQLWKKGEANLTELVHERDGFCALLKIGGAFNGDGEQFRLRVLDGYWRLNARSLAPGTRVRVMVVKLKKPGSFRGVVREHHWEKGQQPVRLIHSRDGIAFLSGLAGSFQGDGEYARVRLDTDGYWYLEGRSLQRSLHAWATSIELTGMELPSANSNPASKADQAIAALKELGFEFDDDNRKVEIGYPDSEKLQDDDFAHFRDLPEVTELKMYYTPLTDKGLAHLVALKKLKKLKLHRSQITDEGLKLIGQLTSLEEFALGTDDAPKVTGAGLMHLKSLTRMRQLEVSAAKVGPGGLAFLSDMHDLEDVSYASNNQGIDESDLKTLGSLSKLEWISLSGEKAVNDGTIAHLSNLKALQFLFLNDTSISDRALLTLKDLPELSVLELRGTQVSDDGMRTVAGMTSLAGLDLSGTRVTGRGLALLKDLRVNSLTLNGRGVTDDHLVGLREWKQLRTLELSGEYDADRRRSIPNSITLNGIKLLSEMKQLDVLKLNDNPQINDAAIPFLSKLEKLVALELQNTGVTPAGGRRLAAAVDGLDYDELLIGDE